MDANTQITLLGKRIRFLREQQNLSQRRFALMMGITHSNLSDIENGKGNPKVGTLCNIADALGVELIELFDF